MRPKLKSETRLSIAIAFTALIALQVIVAPLAASTTAAWDFSGTHGFYNGVTGMFQAGRPLASEVGGTLWTTHLQDLAFNTTLPSTANLKICLVLPTTGGLGTIGIDEIRGATTAILQANRILGISVPGVNFTVPPPRADSGTTASQANTAWHSLTDSPSDCEVTVGAAGTGETSGFLSDANAAQIPTISPSSTAASFAIDGDMLFRSVGDDIVQAAAAAVYVYSQGVRHVAMITRDDPYGTGFRDIFRTEYIALGGTVESTTPTTYDPASIPAAQAATDSLNTQIGTLLASNPASQVGVFITAFEDDGHAIFDRARTTINLPLVQWYGNDGIGGSLSFIPPPDGTASPEVAQFMSDVNVTGTFPTSPAPASGGELALNGAIVPRRGGGTIDVTDLGYDDIYVAPPQPYWDYAYDAAILAMLAVLNATSYTGSAIWPSIIGLGNITIGATGLLSLGTSGDRSFQHYIIYGFTATTSVPALPNAYIALTLFFIAATATLTIARKRRL